MSLERKQHADLVKHREFNALRRLMMARDPKKQLDVADQATQVSRFASTQAINQINALEVQMSRQILGTESPQDFGHTRIVPITRELEEKKVDTNRQTDLIRVAADHFAHQRLTQAQSVLEAGISGGGGLLQEQAAVWLAYMDLCRATNQHDRFESFALDFSVRFGRSAPPWQSFPALAEAATLEHANQPNAVSGQVTADWTAPVYLTLHEIQTLTASILQAEEKSKQVVLDFRPMASFDAGRWADLRSALDTLASRPIRCQIIGLSELQQVFHRQSADEMFAEMELLRCMNQQQGFEDLAFEYCIAHEVSPPDWHAPLCRLETEIGRAPMPSQSNEQALLPELYGSLLGEQSAGMIMTIESFDGIAVRCDRLLRCDQVAALILVQWGQLANRRGHQVEFHGLHRLLESYLASQGLAQYAKLLVRKD